MSKVTTKDLTQGNPLKLILAFMWPVLLGGIFQQLYTFADTLIVGRTISLDALGAVGTTGPVVFLLQGFAMGLSSGFSVWTAQRFGAHDEESVKRSIAVNIQFSIFLSVVLTVLSAATAIPVLHLMQVPSEIFEMSWQYVIVIYLGFAGIVFYNMFAQLLRALGDSKTPLYFLILTCFLNVGLDFAFILGARMGVAGAALATVLSQVVSVVFCMIYAFKKFPVFRIKKEHWKFSWSLLKSHLRIGLPMAFMFSLTAIGVIVNQAVLNSLGDKIAIATYTAASKVEQFLSQTFVAVGFATATFVSQNYGAGKMDRVKQGVWISVAIEAVLAAISCILVMTAGQAVMMLFLDPEITTQDMSLVMDYSKIFFFTDGPGYFLLSQLFVFRNALQGVGKSIGTVFGGAAELILRVMAALILGRLWGFQGVCLANPAAWLGAMLVQVILFVYFFKKINKTNPPTQTKTDDQTDSSVEAVAKDLPQTSVELVSETIKNGRRSTLSPDLRAWSRQRGVSVVAQSRRSTKALCAA